MRVANKLTPEPDQSNFKTKPSSYLFQIARGSGATMEIPKNTKIYI